MSEALTAIAALLAAGAMFLLAFALSERVIKHLRVDDADEKRPSGGFSAPAEKRSQVEKLLQQWARKISPAVPTGMNDKLSRNIVMAGGLAGLTPAQLFLYALFSLLFALSLGVLLVLSTGWSAGWVLGFAVLGALFPFIWLRDQVKRRHLEILNDLPYHIDLLTLCVEAGLDFGAAVARMVDKGKPGALHEEFSAFLSEIRVGKTRAESLQAMSQRVGLAPFSTLLSSLVQADRMGSGLGRTLRLQADQLRSERFQRAEKAGNEAPVKMLLPLVLFIFPTIWIILGGPLVFDWLFKAGP